MGDELLPCPSCGQEAFGGADVTVEIPAGYQYGGKKATYELAGKCCPNCGEEFAL